MEQNYLLVFYSQLLKRVPVVLCLGALSGPRENPPLKIGQNSLILDFNCQPLRRVPFCFMSVGPYGPGGVLSDFEGGVGVPKVYNRTDPVIVSLVYTGQYFEAAAH